MKEDIKWDNAAMFKNNVRAPAAFQSALGGQLFATEKPMTAKPTPVHIEYSNNIINALHQKSGSSFSGNLGTDI
jgi:hypothetical protein